MESPQGLKILKLCSVAPPPETTTTTLPLTFFDIPWFRFPPVARLFFYEYPQPTKSFFDSVLPKLQHSLSLTLQHYLPLAGSLLWPHDSAKPFIKYVPGDAVSLTVAQSGDDFDCLTGNLCEALKSHALVPHLTISTEKACVMALQVTLFPNSGFSIGITAHHAVLDGNSLTCFRKSWAYICHKLVESSSASPPPSLTEQFLPFFDRTVIQDRSRIAEIFAKEWLNENGPNNRSLAVWDSSKEFQDKAIRGTFELKSQDIENLKKYVQSKLENNNKVHLSTFSVTCSYVLTCLVKAEPTKEERLMFTFSVDWRSRLEPKIPPTYFGNCIGGQKVFLETKELLGFNGLIYANEGITEALNRVKDEGLNGPESWVSDMKRLHGLRISVAGSPRFDVYGVDFGWGRPKKVETPSIDKTGAFCLSERRDGDGGVEIELVLGKNEMEAFADLFAKGFESL